MNRSWSSFLALVIAVLGAGYAWRGLLQPLPAAPAVVVPFTGPSEERDSIVAEAARRVGVPVPLAIAVSHVEDWSGDSTATNPTSGCVGLMQVCPKIWADSFPVECGSEQIVQRWRNACVGNMIALRYFQVCGDWECALRLYFGAVCRPYDSPLRCTAKRKAGDVYVRSVVQKMFRTDLSPARDRLARGAWRGPPQIGTPGGVVP